LLIINVLTGRFLVDFKKVGKKYWFLEKGLYLSGIKQTKRNEMTTTELRNNTSEMTKEQFINLRDKMENNWKETLRPSMQVLALTCINKFGITLSNLK